MIGPKSENASLRVLSLTVQGILKTANLCDPDSVNSKEIGKYIKFVLNLNNGQKESPAEQQYIPLISVVSLCVGDGGKSLETGTGGIGDEVMGLL